MSMDLSQFHDVFFDEAHEAVEIIESQLLAVQLDQVDPEIINTIFRAAHSVKGGSATLGFSQVALYTHHMETLLDEIRANKRQLTQLIIDTLLQSVDTLRLLLDHARQGTQLEDAELAPRLAALQRILDGQDAPPTTDVAAATTAGGQPPAPTTAQDAAIIGWRIVFTPHKELMQRGNDPLRIIRELALLGESQTAECDLSLLPEWDQLEPTHCHLSWALKLEGGVAQAALEEVFAWVEDECDLALIPQIAPQTGPEATTDTLAPAAASDPSTDPATALAAQPGNAPAATTPQQKSLTAPAAAQNTSIRVDLGKVDTLINMVGELVITQSMLNALTDHDALPDPDRLAEGLVQLQRQTRALQEGVMQIRMLPISFCFSRFPRMVRDLTRQLGKEIDLVMSGETTEVDKSVIEQITDPLVHLVRNCVDHGVESPQQRLATDKPAQGTVWLRAYHEVGNIVIEIEDDGRGLDPEKLISKARSKGLIGADAKLSADEARELIFLPGFSTHDTATDLSGRGVGMDVVKRNVTALGGSITLHSQLGKGTRFVIRLPLTLAIMDGQLVKVADETYIVPLLAIIESLQPHEAMLNRLGNQQETLKLRGEYLPVVRLSQLFNAPQPADVALRSLTAGIVVVVEYQRKRFGLFVDDLLNQQQIVVKSLEDNFRTLPGISGATILGDGRVALIIDVGTLFEQAEEAA